MASLSLDSGRARLKGYVQRLSGRERLLLVGLALVGLGLAPVRAYDWRQSQLAALLQDRIELQAATRQDDAVQLRRLSRQLADQQRRLRAWSWTTSSFGVARVLLEQQVAVAAVKAGMTDPDIQAADEPDQVGAARFVRLELSAPFTWSSFSGLMQRLTDGGRGLVVDNVTVDEGATNPQLHLTMLLPFVPSDDALQP